MTLCIAAIAYLLLHADPWIWALPPIVTALVLAKWALARGDEHNGTDSP